MPCLKTSSSTSCDEQLKWHGISIIKLDHMFIMIVRGLIMGGLITIDQSMFLCLLINTICIANRIFFIYP